ncbi:MAG: Tex family protein [Planctomycetota bacterium]
MDAHQRIIAGELELTQQQVAATAALLAEGATVPFIARYRKEATGSLDEVQITAIRDRLAELAELDKRRASMRSSLQERDLLTPELARALDGAASMSALEDLYLPYRPKRRTRAQLARERGLEPLAQALLAQDGRRIDAAAFVDPEQELPDTAACLAGARDIIAETISEDATLRSELRDLVARQGQLRARVVKKQADTPEAARFRDWFDWSEPLHRAPSHRILALLRGADQGVLRVSARPDEDHARRRIEQRYLRGGGLAREQVQLACAEAWERLLRPALENEALGAAKRRADAEAIAIFQTNLRELLLAAPLGRKPVLAIDPGQRTGCKVAVLDAQGDLLEHDLIHLCRGRAAEQEAAGTLRRLVAAHAVRAIAIGNGTGARETECFVRGLDLSVAVTQVDESGASIYSASAIARSEFPDLDLTVRGAISIGRRLQDPLAELVKLDPKTIGVGQYQHDVDQQALRRGLSDVVEQAVNQVGVEVNSASAALLTHVAGLGPKLAEAIVTRRAQQGPFRSRRDLLQVPRLGARAFQQCAGFLRVTDGAHPLDASAVHPERYQLVERMAADQGCDLRQLMHDRAIRSRIDLRRYRSDTVGEPTLQDIMAELDKPGRDPRPAFDELRFADVHRIEDLEAGMVLPGVVTNVAAFGAFVDVGVHQDGLVHISQLADRFVRDPNEVVSVRQQVQVRVLEVDLQRRRIALSMRGE